MIMLLSVMFCFLNHSVSEYITRELKMRNDRSFGGHARALAVSNGNIAIGTSRGSVLIFSCKNQRSLQCFF